MKPLQGCRVLDLTTNISGPFATMILAELGAEVIKIERVDKGDDARYMGPYFGDWGVYFCGINRNKKSLGVNFKSPDGKEIIYKLAETCDIVIENFRGGKANELGLGFEDFKRIKQDIVYCSLSAYGQAGPLKERPGYDALVQAQTGIISINGVDEKELARVGVSLLDMGSGMWAAMGILAAMHERDKSGQGQFVATSLYQTGIMWSLYHLLYFQSLGVNPSPQGTRHTAFAPYGDYIAKNGKIFIGVSNDRIFSRLCKAIGKENLAMDDRFKVNAKRLENRNELDSLIETVLQDKSVEDWLTLFDREGIPAAKIQTISDVLEDSHLKALDQMATVNVPNYGEVKIPKIPLDFGFGSEPDDRIQPAPTLGMDTVPLLRELGYIDEDIERLANQSVVVGIRA